MSGVPCGALQHHTVPKACAIICSWLLIMVHTGFCQKPAKLPLVSRKPFLAAWNAPLDMCTLKYNINVSLDLFHISGSPRAVHTGQNVTIFYANRLGYYPFYNEQGAPINGGLPQNSSLEAHLRKARKDIAHFIPSEDFRGLAVIDWEFWRPQWSRNWHKKEIYKQNSRDLISQAYVNVTKEQVDELARLRFEKTAMEFMQGTLQIGTQTRPHGLWGFYLYPDCHNYNVHAHNYSGTCPLLETLRNDELFWLWNSSTALFPALAIRKDHADSIRNLHFSKNRVLESLRLASLTSLPYELPTYVYTRLGYRDEAMAFLTQHNCSKVRAFLNHRLGQYITNVTRAAEVCSEFLCQSNGRCVRRDPEAPHYLHLSRASYRILNNRNGTFTVTGWHSQRELQLLAERFRCHCYLGYEGDRCKSIEPIKKEEDEKKEDQHKETRDTAVPLQNAFVLTALLLLLNFSGI
ncbi:hyaluronidase-4-like isoform X2 [Xyrauchen texanus]|uniref:hyaluronidase-4-like isoform X2 n=1 Tax=Xyrauchen texanus TaxID=154827 RepID=UPI0022423E7C|nr:hyaluronidase-4-like isoform X2 [Xyrauchen texanus]